MSDMGVGDRESGVEEAKDAEETGTPGAPTPDPQPPTPDIDKQVRRMSRRGFFVAGVSAIAAYGGWRWLNHASRIGQTPWPLRRTLETNEKLAEAYFSPKRLSPTFPPSALTNARINGGIGLSANNDPNTWRLNVAGNALSLADIQAFPKREMITEFRCIEGWSYLAKWSGARLADVMAKFPPPPDARYVAMETAGREYYVGLDMQSAMHPQTLLAYELNDQPRTWQHGAPLRLAIPVKYGIKNIKRMAAIRYANDRPADFWAERGYDWYAGH